MKTIDNLNWRYATKQYDNSKEVKEEELDLIKEAIRLSPTSYGLQLFKVLEIKNPELRAQLRKSSWNQPAVTDASRFLVFCAIKKVEDHHVDDYIKLKSNTLKLDESVLAGYGDFVKVKLKGKSSNEQKEWTARQVYIALSNALLQCAELKLDSTPMEGFEVEEYNEILGLGEKNLQACVALAIGHRSTEDTTQAQAKVRKNIGDLFETV